MNKAVEEAFFNSAQYTIEGLEQAIQDLSNAKPDGIISDFLTQRRSELQGYKDTIESYMESL